jgi:predicted sulfurtransferase
MRASKKAKKGEPTMKDTRNDMEVEAGQFAALTPDEDTDMAAAEGANDA